MQLTKLKRINAIQLEVKDTTVLWFIDQVTTPADVEAKIPEGVDLVLVNRSEPFTDAEQVDVWDLFSQKLKSEKNTVIVFSAGEFRVKDVHMKGSSIDSVTHYMLETPDGSVAFFQTEPSDAFIKQYSPIDVIVGRDTALAGIQLDLEPFYVVLATLSEDYKKKSGVSEVNQAEKVTVKKIEASAREGNVSMNVYAI
jgi:hypothetical protein